MVTIVWVVLRWWVQKSTKWSRIVQNIQDALNWEEYVMKTHTSDHPPLLSDPIIIIITIFPMFKSVQCSNLSICSYRASLTSVLRCYTYLHLWWSCIYFFIKRFFLFFFFWLCEGEEAEYSYPPLPSHRPFWSFTPVTRTPTSFSIWTLLVFCLYHTNIQWYLLFVLLRQWFVSVSLSL